MQVVFVQRQQGWSVPRIGIVWATHQAASPNLCNFLRQSLPQRSRGLYWAHVRRKNWNAWTGANWRRGLIKLNIPHPVPNSVKIFFRDMRKNKENYNIYDGRSDWIFVLCEDFAWKFEMAELKIRALGLKIERGTRCNRIKWTVESEKSLKVSYNNWSLVTL